MAEPSRLVDLSHPLEDGRGAYPGFPEPSIGAHLTHEASRACYAPGTEFHIGRIQMVGNTGTYLDAPFHRFRDRADPADLELESLAFLPGLVVDAPAGARGLGSELLPREELRGCAVLLRTGWSRHWGTSAYTGAYPFATGALARELVQRGAALVGIDSLNIDSTDGGERTVHTTLLEAGIPIVEHLCHLEALPARGFLFFAVPVKVRGLDSFPVRAFARVG